MNKLKADYPCDLDLWLKYLKFSPSSFDICQKIL